MQCPLQDETGVPVRTVKSFMSKIPSVFTGQDLISWMLVNLDLSDSAEALMLANRMAASGYFFPIDDHVLQVKNDNTYYRFQVRFQRAIVIKDGLPHEIDTCSLLQCI